MKKKKKNVNEGISFHGKLPRIKRNKSTKPKLVKESKENIISIFRIAYR